jgi:polyisoprenoid-binding protein YceI
MSAQFRLALIATGAVTLLAALPLIAAPASSPAAAPAPAQAAANATTYEIDDVHSAAFFRVQHLGAGQFWGRINDISGSFTTAGSGPEGVSFDITVKVDSIDTGTKKLDDHLRSPDFFNTKEFPAMTFKSTGVKKGSSGLELTGDFTMRGVTKPITAALEFTGQKAGQMGDRAGYEAVFTIKRADFGVNYGVENGSLGNDVRIVVNLEGVKK